MMVITNILLEMKTDMTNLEFCKYLSTLPKLTDDQRAELDVIKSEIKTARAESTKAERKVMCKYFDFVSGLHPDTVMITGSMYNVLLKP